MQSVPSLHQDGRYIPTHAHMHKCTCAHTLTAFAQAEKAMLAFKIAHSFSSSPAVLSQTSAGAEAQQQQRWPRVCEMKRCTGEAPAGGVPPFAGCSS